jgi:hypothetical protein
MSGTTQDGAADKDIALLGPRPNIFSAVPGAFMQDRKPKPKDSITAIVAGRPVKVVKRVSVKPSAAKLKKRHAATLAYLKDK